MTPSTQESGILPRSARFLSIYDTGKLVDVYGWSATIPVR